MEERIAAVEFLRRQYLCMSAMTLSPAGTQPVYVAGHEDGTTQRSTVRRVRGLKTDLHPGA